MLSKSTNDNGYLEKAAATVPEKIQKPLVEQVKEVSIYIFSFSEPVIRGPKKRKEEPPIIKT